MSGFNLAWDRITPEVDVSTGVVHYTPGREWGERWQVETWVFSKDPRQGSRQIIHGDSSLPELPARLREKALRVHGHVVENLRAKLAPEATP